MPYKKPLIKKGIRESPRLHFLKLCWFYVHALDFTDEIKRKDFINNFFEYAESYALFEKMQDLFGLIWEDVNKEDEINKEFNSDVLRGQRVFSRYGWNDDGELYTQFVNDLIAKKEGITLRRYKLAIDGWTVEDMIEYNNLTSRCNYLQELQKAGCDDYDKEIKQIQSSKSMIENRIKERLGLNELNLNIDGSIDMEAYITEGTYSPEEISDLQSVSSKPDESTQRFLDQL